MLHKQSNSISSHAFIRTSLTSILQYSTGRLVAICACFALASTIANPLLGQTLISRDSHLNFNYVFGAGATAFQDTVTETANTLSLSDIHNIGAIESSSGTFQDAPWTAGVSIDVEHQYSITGTVGLFSQIQASGNTTGEANSSGPGSAGLFSSNPGNRLFLNFDLLQSQDFTLNGEVAFSSGNSSNQTAVALQRWDGIVWQSVHNSSQLPGGQGAFSWTGTLNAGQYRMFSGLHGSFGQNQVLTRSYNYDLNFTSVPEPGSASLVFVSMIGIALFRKRRLLSDVCD